MTTEKTKETPVKKQETVKNSETKAVSFVRSELAYIGKIQKEYTAEHLGFIQGLVSKDMNKSELFVFLAFASKAQLNPLTQEIIPIVYDKNDPSKRRVGYIITRNGKRVVAHRQGDLDGITTKAIYVRKVTENVSTDSTAPKTIEKTVLCEAWEGGTLWGATSKVVRSGREYEITVPLTEYNTNQNVWKFKPETMIKKVAESQALSLAYPELLGGTYDEAEAGSIPNDSERKTIVPDGDDSATQAQIDTLKTMGVSIPDNLTKGQATELMTSKKKQKDAAKEVETVAEEGAK